MTQEEKDDLSNEIFNLIPNSDIKKYIEECIMAGNASMEDVKKCVLFKIAARFKSLS
jgi:hypothetical protein